MKLHGLVLKYCKFEEIEFDKDSFYDTYHILHTWDMMDESENVTSIELYAHKDTTVTFTETPNECLPRPYHTLDTSNETFILVKINSEYINVNVKTYISYYEDIISGGYSTYSDDSDDPDFEPDLEESESESDIEDSIE